MILDLVERVSTVGLSGASDSAVTTVLLGSCQDCVQRCANMADRGHLSAALTLLLLPMAHLLLKDAALRKL